MDDFPCTKCGECCRQASKILDKSSDFYKNAPTVIKDLIDRFPYEVNDDGSCSMLDSSGLCKVYNNRPVICNISLMGKLFHQSTLNWFKLQADNCNELIKNANLDPKFLVIIDEKSSEKIVKTYEDGRTQPRKTRKRKNFKKI